MFRGNRLFLALGLSVLGLFLTAACAGADGDPGQRGETGPAGVAGPAGTDGADGAVGADGADGPRGALGATGATGPAGADGADGADGAAGNDAASSEAAAMISLAEGYVTGQESVTVWLSGFLRRDNVSAVIVEAFGPGNDYVMGTGTVNPSGALALTVGSADRPAVPADIEPGIYTVRVTGERVPSGVSGPSKASAPLWVRAPGDVPPVDGK